MTAAPGPLRLMIVLLVALVAVAALSWSLHDAPSVRTLLNRLVWGIFLFGLPLVLAGLAAGGIRWSLMGGVMYGTVGLALDISTVVQELSRTDGDAVTLGLSLVTGVLNAALITVGGHGFLDVVGRPSLPAGRPPNRPSPSSKEPV